MLYSRSTRDEEGEELLARPALAVEGEASNEHQPPADGHEYLRRVRKQALGIPDVVTAQIDPSRLRAAEERSAARLQRSVLNEQAMSLPPPPSVVRPSRAWQLKLLDDFRVTRDKLERCVHQIQCVEEAQSGLLPNANERAAWATFLNLRSLSKNALDDAGAESDENGCDEAGASSISMGKGAEIDEEHDAIRPPLMSLVAQFDQQRAAALLKLLLDSLLKHRRVTASVGRWLFAVLLRYASALPRHMLEVVI